jgi:hypothetical protein
MSISPLEATNRINEHITVEMLVKVFVVDDVATAAAELRKVAGIDQYRGGSDQFMAIGDEHGLLLVMKRGRVISFDSPEKKAVTVFRTAVSVRGTQASEYNFSKFPYQLSVRSWFDRLAPNLSRTLHLS